MNVKISHCKVTLFLISNKNNLNFVIPLRNLYDTESPPKSTGHPSFSFSCFMQFLHAIPEAMHLHSVHDFRFPLSEQIIFYFHKKVFYTIIQQYTIVNKFKYKF